MSRTTVRRECIRAAGATLLHIHLHHFTPNNGVSGVAVLAESHISVHTWPESGFAAFDVFMCEVVPWDMERGLNSIVAGYADLNWGLWWRYNLFLLICRLQRHWKIVNHPAPSAVPCRISTGNVMS